MLVLNKSAAKLPGRLTPPVTRALPRAGAETSTRPAIRTESNTEKRNRSERGIAANLLGDCRAHTEADIFRFYTVFTHSETRIYSSFLFTGAFVCFNCASISRLPYMTRMTVTVFSSLCGI